MRTVYDDFTACKGEVKSIDDIITGSSLDFPVGKGTLDVTYVLHENKETKTYRNNTHCATLRTDTGFEFGIVGAEYGLVPYVHAFSLVDPMLSDGTARVIGLCSINNGQRAYLQLKGKGVLELGGEDTIENYFYLKSSHDGSCAVEVRLAPSRKTTGTVLPIGSTLSLRHSKNANENLVAAKKTIIKIRNDWEEFSEVVKMLAATKITDQEALAYFEAVLGAVNPNNTRQLNVHDSLYVGYKTGIVSKFPASNGTLFGAMQQICYYIDNVRSIRKSSTMDDDSARIESKLHADGARKKTKAYEEAIKKLKALGMSLKLRRR